MPNFIIRRGEKEGTTISGLVPNTALPVGTALMISAKDADTGENTFAVANGKSNGFVSREIRVGPGLTDEEQLFGFGIETPFEAGKSGSVEKAREVECEGGDYIIGSGTGAVTTATAAGTRLSFKNGKFYVAQPSDYAEFRLVKQMTPETPGNTRIYVEAIDGYLVP